MYKVFTLALILVMVVSIWSLLILKPANAQNDIPPPSVPQFTLRFMSQPDYVLVITIKNQHHDSIWSLYYTVRVKDHNAGDDSWRYPFARLTSPIGNQSVYALNADFPEQFANSDYTNVSITVQSKFFLLGDQNDIQVAALRGFIYRDSIYRYIFDGTTSGWSSTQTITIPTGYISNPTPIPTPSQTVQPPPTLPEFASPTIPEFPALAILLFLLTMFAVVLLFSHRKNS
jgi:hypothetical protein